MNYKRIAKMYLDWFYQEAQQFSVSNPDGSSSIVWNGSGMFAMQYRTQHGSVRWQEFVAALANDRLNRDDAREVILAAGRLAA